MALELPTPIVAQCWTSAFIKDLVVLPEARRRSRSILKFRQTILPAPCAYAKSWDCEKFRWVDELRPPELTPAHGEWRLSS